MDQKNIINQTYGFGFLGNSLTDISPDRLSSYLKGNVAFNPCDIIRCMYKTIRSIRIAIFNFLNMEHFLITMQNIIADLLNDCNITLLGFSKFLVYFIAGILIYRIFCLALFPKPHKVYFKYNIFTFAYFANWYIIAMLVLKHINLVECYSKITLSNVLFHSNMFLIYVAISIAIFLIISLIILYFPIFMMTALLVTFLIAGSIALGLHIEPSLFNISCFSIPFLIGVLCVIFFTKSTKKYMNRLKNSMVLLFSNLCPIVVFLCTTASIHFLKIYLLKIIYMNTEYRMASQFYLIFLFAWAYFTTSYINNVFIAAMLHFSNAGIENPKSLFNYSAFKIAISRCHSSMNYIAYCAMIPAFFQTVISILETVYDSLTDSKLALLRMIGKMIYLILWFLEMASFFIDIQNRAAFTEIGINGISSYMSIIDNSYASLDNSQADKGTVGSFIYPSSMSFSQMISRDRLLLYSLKLLPYIALTIGSFLNYKFISQSIEMTLYYMFVSYSLLTCLISSILISYQIQASTPISNIPNSLYSDPS